MKKVKKTDKNGKRISRIRETEEEEENRFLLNILERREEGNASKKTVTSKKKKGFLQIFLFCREYFVLNFWIEISNDSLNF